MSIKLSQTPTLKVSEKKDPLSRTHSQGFSRFLKVSDKLSQTPTIKLSQTPTKLSQTPTLKVSETLTHKTLTLTYIGGKGTLTNTHSRTKHSLSLTSAARGLLGGGSS